MKAKRIVSTVITIEPEELQRVKEKAHAVYELAKSLCSLVEWPEQPECTDEEFELWLDRAVIERASNRDAFIPVNWIIDLVFGEDRVSMDSIVDAKLEKGVIAYTAKIEIEPTVEVSEEES